MSDIQQDRLGNTVIRVVLTRSEVDRFESALAREYAETGRKPLKRDVLAELIRGYCLRWESPTGYPPESRTS